LTVPHSATPLRPATILAPMHAPLGVDPARGRCGVARTAVRNPVEIRREPVDDSAVRAGIAGFVAKLSFLSTGCSVADAALVHSVPRTQLRVAQRDSRVVPGIRRLY
jgi:hypothetical protein